MAVKEQMRMVTFGVLLGKEDSLIDIDSFKSLDDLTSYINLKFNTNIKTGMVWDDAIKEIKRGINETKYKRGMSTI